jgi:hypothetical protein
VRYFLIFCLVQSVIFNTQAQQQSNPEWVFSIAGFDFQGNESGYTFSIGTVFTKTLQAGNAVLSTGIMQAVFTPCLEGKTNYYPNPVSNFIIIRYEGCEDRFYKIEFIDVHGKLVGSFTASYDNTFDLNQVPPGILLVRGFLSNGEIVQFKIIKKSS